MWPCESEQPSPRLTHDLYTHDVCRPQDFSVNCVDCSIDGEIGISAGGSWLGDHIQPPPDVEEIPSGFNFKDKWVAATLDKLDAIFKFGINLTATKASNEFIVPIDSKTISRTVNLIRITLQ